MTNQPQRLNRLHDLYQTEGARGAARGIARYWRHQVRPAHRAKCQLLRLAAGNRLEIDWFEGSLLVDLTAGPVHRDLAVDGIREAWSLQRYRADMRAAPAGTTIIDCGSNIGHIPIAVADVVDSIRCVEPDPRNCDWLLKNIALNRDLRAYIEMLEAALGPDRGSVAFDQARAPNLNQVSELAEFRPQVGSGRAVEQQIEVPMTTLDTIVPDTGPVVLRMDVEGYESEILAGATFLFQTTRPLYLWVELHAESISQAMLDGFVNRCRAGGLELQHCVDGGGESGRPVCANWDEVRESSRNLHVFASRGFDE